MARFLFNWLGHVDSRNTYRRPYIQFEHPIESFVSMHVRYAQAFALDAQAYSRRQLALGGEWRCEMAQMGRMPRPLGKACGSCVKEDSRAQSWRRVIFAEAKEPPRRINIRIWESHEVRSVRLGSPSTARPTSRRGACSRARRVRRSSNMRLGET
ncbi:hypothetical protein K402DRAFT_33156 [Aulographum hederae CBS 113979]|uniref:Uncharacterized protein n=1 Tax=Aulographum hederae CBS 113979 TaxID=1176131 RepID=A0A6G1H5J8_9PEZI|nr:hypothetical protein K402DRAFT_33156 [Aulographum hederae CBS 113979]